MVRKICLDSDILIELLNKNEDTRDLLDNLDASFCISSVTSFELWWGRKQSEPIFETLEQLDIISFDDKAARCAGDLLRDLSKNGTPLDMRDLFIAATCIAHGIELLTYNKKHFERVQKFGLILIAYV